MELGRHYKSRLVDLHLLEITNIVCYVILIKMKRLQKTNLSHFEQL